MTVTNLLDSKSIKTELIVFLRSSDVFSIAQRGVTTTTEEFNGTGAALSFTLTNTPVRNVRTVTIGGVASAFGTDYSVNYSTAVVTFVVAPGVGTNNVDVTYDYGATDKIYGDIPRCDLGITSYPRIAVQLTSVKTDELGLGAMSNLNDLLFSVYVYDDNGDDVEDYVKLVRQKFLEAKKSFFYVPFITPVSASPLINEPDRGDKVLVQSLELRGLFQIEEIS